MSHEADGKISISAVGAALRSPKGKRWGKWLAGGVLAFGVLGYFAAPPLLKSVLLDQLAKELHREVSIEQIDINPYALSARISGVSVKAEGGHEVVGFDELFVNVSSFSIFQAGIVVDEIRLRGPRIAVARLADGRYDISDLLDEWMKPKDEPEKPLPRFSLNNIQVLGGKLVFDDRPECVKHTDDDLNFTLPFVSSLPYQADVLVEPAFAAVIDGSPLVLKGRSKPFAGSHESELDLDLDRLDLARLQPYLPDGFPIRLERGVLDSELKVVFKEVSDKVFSLAMVGAAHLSDLAVAESGGAPLVGWKRLDVELDKADLINRDIGVSKVLLDGLAVQVAVNKQGEINLLNVVDRLKGPPAKSAAPAPASEAAPAVRWSLGGFVLSNATLNWRDESQAVPLAGAIRQIDVKVGALKHTLAEPVVVEDISYQLDFGERLKVDRVHLKDTRVDLAQHRVNVGEWAAGPVRANVLRDAKGQLAWLQPPVLKAPAKAAPQNKAVPEAPWVGSVDKLAIEDVALRFEDKAVSPAAIQEIDGFSIRGEGLGNEPGKKGKLSVAGRINKKGSLKLDGAVQLMPLNAALKVETVAVPLLPVQPYFSEALNIALTRGQVSNQGEVIASQDKDGLKAAYKGSLTLGDFLAVDKLNSADFLKWKSLYFGGLDVRLDPMTVNVGEIALADFYSRLILNKDGRLNLADIVRKPAGATEVAPVKATSENKQAAAKPLETKPAETPAKPPLPIKIAKITLQNGTVNFSDYFVKPNYSVNLTKLGGRVTNLSSAADTVADMELRGSYANSAPVLIQAKLNPLAANTYLDLKADISGVDMVGFSPYAGKYAGYNIEKGKLSLNVAYKLQDRQLSAENRLFIDQFTFGEKVESPDATKLPVNLAISLLKNNRGEIDLNLPIGGSLDDPQFSVGGLVVKVIVNLFVKAVTSPFALLGSMFGGGEELSNIEFAPGYAAFDDTAGKKLAALAKALNDRESLKLEITGRADPEADKEGIKRVAIERAMKAEKLKDILKKKGEGVSIDSVEIAQDEYTAYLTRAYKEAKFPKPRNVIGMQKDLPVAEMEKLMLTNLPATAEDVQALAVRRAEAVQSWLVEQGKVPVARIFLLPPKVEVAKSDADKAKSSASRVDFSLR